MGTARLFVLAAAAVAQAPIAGCATGGQPVVWAMAGPVHFDLEFDVEVTARVPMPVGHLESIRAGVRQELGRLFRGDAGVSERYTVRVAITRYDEGDQFARLMFPGAGSMHLYADVEVVLGPPPRMIRSGGFKKVYSLGGIFGATADMRGDMVPQVSKAIAQALLPDPPSGSNVEQGCIKSTARCGQPPPEKVPRRNEDD